LKTARPQVLQQNGLPCRQKPSQPQRVEPATAVRPPAWAARRQRRLRTSALPQLQLQI